MRLRLGITLPRQREMIVSVLWRGFIKLRPTPYPKQGKLNYTALTDFFQQINAISCSKLCMNSKDSRLMSCLEELQGR